MTPAFAVVLVCGLFETRPFEPGELDAHLRTLATSTSNEEVKKSASELRRRTGRDETDRVLTALDSAYTRLTDEETRERIVLASGLLAVRHRELCPILLCRVATEEQQTQASTIANNLLSMYFSKRIPKAGEEYLFRMAGSPSRNLRGNGLSLIGEVLPDHPRTRPILREARNDTDPSARQNAHAKLYNLSNRIEDFLPYTYWMIREFNSLKPLPDTATDEEKAIRTSFNLCWTGCVHLLVTWAEERPVEFRTALLTVSRHPKAEVRLEIVGRVELLAEAWINPIPIKPKEGDDPEVIRAADERRRRGYETLFGDGQLAARLAEMAAKDPDSEVRKWAKHARDTICGKGRGK
jgi:hypothetical protein